MVKNERGIVLVGEGRQTEWPDQVPSYPHPVVVRLLNDQDPDGHARTLLRFDHAVTGYESYELTPSLVEEIKKRDKMYPNAGGMGWPALSVKTDELVQAIEALQKDTPGTWVAHGTVINAQGQAERAILKEPESAIVLPVVQQEASSAEPPASMKTPSENGPSEDVVPPAKVRTMLEEADRHFERQVGLDPDRDLAKALGDSLRNKTPKASIGEIMLAPVGYENQRHWEDLKDDSARGKEQSLEVVRSLQKAAEEKLAASKASGKLLGVEGVLKTRPDALGKDGIKAEIRTKEGLDFKVVAFGAPAQALRHTKAGDVVKVAGLVQPPSSAYARAEVKLVQAERVQERARATGRDR